LLKAEYSNLKEIVEDDVSVIRTRNKTHFMNAIENISHVWNKRFVKSAQTNIKEK